MFAVDCVQGNEMPSLWDAIAGRVVKTYSSHSGYEIERTWGWKDDSLMRRCRAGYPTFPSAHGVQAILDQYLRNVIASTLPAAARVFGWPLDEARRTVEALAEQGRVSPGVKCPASVNSRP